MHTCTYDNYQNMIIIKNPGMYMYMYEMDPTYLDLQ